MSKPDDVINLVNGDDGDDDDNRFQITTAFMPDSSDNEMQLVPYQIQLSGLTVVINGVLSPVVIVVTVVTNCLVCIVLLKPSMRTPTNLLLASMAVADILTGIFPLVPFLVFYTGALISRMTSSLPQEGGVFTEWGPVYVPYSWCSTYFALVDYMPTAFHTASVWLTMALAAHRYVCISYGNQSRSGSGSGSGVTRHSLSASIVSRQERTVLQVVAVIFVLAALSQASRFFEYSYSAIELPGNDTTAAVIATGQRSTGTTGCLRNRSTFLEQYAHVYYNIYFWFRVIFIHFIPCCALTVFNVLLIVAMRRAYNRRRTLLQAGAAHAGGTTTTTTTTTECRRLADSNLTTLMLVVVVGVMLVVEMPTTIMLVLTIVDNVVFKQRWLDSHAMRIGTLVVNVAILFSYPVNFFIYCAMSQQFRATFGQMCNGCGSVLVKLLSCRCCSCARAPFGRPEASSTHHQQQQQQPQLSSSYRRRANSTETVVRAPAYV